MNKFLITLGDPEGIGPELVNKSRRKLLSFKSPVVLIGSRSYLKGEFKKCYVDDISKVSGTGIYLVDIENHMAGYGYLKTALDYLKTNHESVVITLPVSKNRIARYNPEFTGHTDLFRTYFKKDILMSFCHEKFRATLLTEHIPLSDVAESITLNSLKKIFELTYSYTRKYFNINNPKIAVSGLNPHGGDKGLIGREESVIQKAVHSFKNKIEGPHSVEYLVRHMKDFDFVIFMYHDQILPLLKTMYPSCVNMTLGLPFLRFSPSHGPAYDIVGTNVSDTQSFLYIFKYFDIIKRHAG